MGKTVLHKRKESVLAVLPITLLILVLNFCIVPMEGYSLAAFLFGAVFLILGMSMYTFGIKQADGTEHPTEE